MGLRSLIERATSGRIEPLNWQAVFWGMAAFELDHLFVWADAGGPEAELLVAIGLIEGAPNTHPGQGTTCRRSLFRNAYLELVWVGDPAEAQGQPVGPTRIRERWAGRRTGESPFGLGPRPVPPSVSPDHNRVSRGARVPRPAGGIDGLGVMK
jgi:hypothetical protein